jgi:hypothetical protein
MPDHNSDFFPSAVTASVHSKQQTGTVNPVTALTTPASDSRKARVLEEAPYSTLSHPTAVKPT